MPILNQRRTGKPCPRKVESLMAAIEKRDGASMMQFISVHCLELAYVLDRLEALEEFQTAVLAGTAHIRRHRSVG